MPLALTDVQWREIKQAAQLVPLGLRGLYLERLALELQGKDLANADGMIHRIAYRIARSITWTSDRTAIG